MPPTSAPSATEAGSKTKGRVIVTTILVLAIGGGLIAVSQGKRLIEIRLKRMGLQPPTAETQKSP
jgi:adenine deaminase